MATQNGSIYLRIRSRLASALDLSTVRDPLLKEVTTTLANGAGANAANVVWHDQRTLAASGTENLDLAGSLTDALGATATFARIKALYIAAAAGNTNNVVVGGAAANTWTGPFADATDKVSLRPGAYLLLVAPDATGYAVTADTADQLKIANSAGSTSVTYDIILIGAAT